MPPKKKKGGTEKKGTIITSKTESNATISEESEDIQIDQKRAKPLTRKEKENMKKQEKALKEKILQLRKEADQLLADLKATEEAAQRKAENEMNAQTKRIELLTGTVENFKFAKARLLHELNKFREKEIWDRYINTNQMPYPEVSSNMSTHLFLWKAIKSSEQMDFALPKCDEYMSVFNILDDLIDHPIFAEKETVANWKETRAQWRGEFFHTMDKACFNLIKNLEANFDKRTGDQADVYTYEDETDQIRLAVIAWLQGKDSIGPKASPKITIPSMNVHVVMPATYRKDPFILRAMHLDVDFLSDSSLTFHCPEGMPMEADMLAEVKRCFYCKADAKASVADREREKVRIAKQKVTEAQAAAQMAERSFESLLQKTKKSTVTPDVSTDQAQNTQEDETERTKKKKPREFAINLEAGSEMISPMGAAKRLKGLLGDDETITPLSVMQSEGTQRALDAISMRSGMRKKLQARMKQMSRTSDEEEICTNVFYTNSMISISERRRKVVVRIDSELCFEVRPDDVDSKSESSELESEASFDSLELMFGKAYDDGIDCKSVKTLVRNTKIMSRDKGQKVIHSKSVFAATGKPGRKRGKSLASMKKFLEDSDEVQQTASDIYESKEDIRQENYMTSFVFADIPNRRTHVNLRMFNTVGGVYFLDAIFHVSQPKTLKDGSTVQIFFGEQNIKRINYEYEYVPPPPTPETEDPDVPIPVDQGLQHLLLVKVPLPKKVVFGSKPIIALWDREQKYWTKQHVYNSDIDFTTEIATFKLGRIWPFAFLLNKFAFLPFKKWIMKPKFDICGVTVMIQTQTMIFEFVVANSEVCLNSVEGILQASVIEDFVGVYMQVKKLVKIMKSRGLNIFPDNDSFLYVNDNTAKDPVLEDHAYMSMAMFSDILEFQSSQWNSDCKRRKLAFQARECLAYNLELRLRTVTAAPLSACLYRCSDEEALDDSKMDNLGFCPDTYSLLEKAFAHAAPTTTLNALQVITVYALLSRVRILSYCGSYRKDTTSSSSESSKKSPKKKSKKSGKQRGKYKNVGSRSSQASISILFSEP